MMGHTRNVVTNLVLTILVSLGLLVTPALAGNEKGLSGLDSATVLYRIVIPGDDEHFYTLESGARKGGLPKTTLFLLAGRMEKAGIEIRESDPNVLLIEALAMPGEAETFLRIGVKVVRPVTLPNGTRTKGTVWSKYLSSTISYETVSNQEWMETKFEKWFVRNFKTIVDTMMADMLTARASAPRINVRTR